MHDTGFIGLQLTQFLEILQTYSITMEQMETEVSKPGLHVVTISFNGAAQDASRRKEVLDSAKVAMTFLKNFGAERLLLFSTSRNRCNTSTIPLPWLASSGPSMPEDKGA